MDTFILATQYMFWVGFVGMAAGTMYFLVERNSLPEKYRETATVAALVTFVTVLDKTLGVTVAVVVEDFLPANLIIK